MTRVTARFSQAANQWNLIIYDQSDQCNRQMIFTVSHEAFCGMANQLTWAAMTRTDVECGLDVADDDQWEPTDESTGQD
jgi:hypothetical protein